MTLSSTTDRSTWRYAADARQMEALAADEVIRERLASPAYTQVRHASRTQILAGAVMVEPDVLPHLAAAVSQLRERFADLKPVECFVFNSPEINAFISESRTHAIVGLSSATVNHLDVDELTFVLGHEFGHAAFGHLDMLAGHLAADPAVSPAATMRVRSWQRSAEISADRAGLMLCGSLEAAARSLFKVASGIVSPAVAVVPDRFAAQWQRLIDAVIQEGDRDFHHFSHPFPPLRMRAMQLFWNARREPRSFDDRPLEAADEAIDRMLATMDPASGSDRIGDPLLSGHLFWGGLYLVTGDLGPLHEAERERLGSIAPAGISIDTAAEETRSSPDRCRERFAAAFRDRQRSHSALELHRIIFGLLDVAAADGDVSELERSRLHELVDVLGIPADACDLVMEHYKRDYHDA
jgi:uncharacterized tellurite resistance protein B-like protein